MQYLHNEELIPDEEGTVGTSTMSDEELLQLKQLELQERECKREAQFKLKELEYKKGN